MALSAYYSRLSWSAGQHHGHMLSTTMSLRSSDVALWDSCSVTCSPRAKWRHQNVKTTFTLVMSEPQPVHLRPAEANLLGCLGHAAEVSAHRRKRRILEDVTRAVCNQALYVGEKISFLSALAIRQCIYYQGGLRVDMVKVGVGSSVKFCWPRNKSPWQPGAAPLWATTMGRFRGKQRCKRAPPRKKPYNLNQLPRRGRKVKHLNAFELFVWWAEGGDGMA